VPVVSRPQTEKNLSMKACDTGAEITSCATSGTAAQHASVANTRQQNTELEVVTLSCTGSGSFWQRLHCSMSCFLELVPLCPPALLPDAEIAGQELNGNQHQQLLSLGMMGHRQHTEGIQ